jgi:nickel-dependent lactate racemase
MILAEGREDESIGTEELENLCKNALSKCELEGERVLVIIPDSTRTAPVPVFFRIFCNLLLQEVRKLDFLIALGTHPLMSEQEINKHLGISMEERKTKFKRVGIFNHSWDSPQELRQIGTIDRREVKKLSVGLLSEDIPILINKRIFDYDHLIILGPVFPHEIVGFSGGYKYFFPGISGPEMVNRSHWLGALLTNPKIDGSQRTPVRELINRAASFVSIPTIAFCLVMQGNQIHGLYVGNPIEAQEKAAELSAKLNIRWKGKQFHLVLSMAPSMYKELWTAGKCMYKLEPVIEDGGKLIIYAPHIKEISFTHGKLIREIGYHPRDYFLKQWDKFKNYPGAILAHSTHLKGIGTYKDGVEKPRIEVILATGIPRIVCEEVNLGYMDPKEINLEDYANREDEGILLVREAGEMLYRLADGSVPNIDKLYKKEK